MKSKKYLVELVAFLAIVILSLSCSTKQSIDKKESGDMAYSKIISLKFDTLLFSQIVDFYPIGNSSYLLTDGACIYKTDSTGAIIKKINDQGHAKNEYIKIGKIFSDGKNIYAWCTMSLYLYKYDMDLNFMDKYKGPNHAITKFTVSKNDTAYFLLSGGCDEEIGILPLNHNAQPSYFGCYTNEDKALLTNSISGGITVYNNQLKYVKPSEITVCNVNYTKPWTYYDKDFFVHPIKGDLFSYEREEILNYILTNSICSGLYSDDEYLWLITETGTYDYEENGIVSSKKRFLNLHKIDKDGKILSSHKYNHPGGFCYLVHEKNIHILFYDEKEERFIIKLHGL